MASRVYETAQYLLSRSPHLLGTGEPAEGQQQKTLAQSEFQVQSQNGEDGILAEIFRRIGTLSNTFVEIGVEWGAEGNCVFLADWCAWQGWFIEGDDGHFTRLGNKYGLNPRVATVQSYVTPQNVNDLLRRSDVPYEVDLFSIDVDGADF